MDSLLLILKLLGLIASAVFGILGTMHDFRNQDGRLTRWGKVSIMGTVASVFVAVSAQLMENHLQKISANKAALQALESTQRLEKIVFELNRTIQPLESVSVYITDLGVPMDDPLLHSYKQKLNNGLEKFLKLTSPDERYSPQQGVFVSSFTPVNGINVPKTVEVSRASSLFPKFNKKSFAGQLLDIRRIDLAFYRVPIATTDFQPAVFGRSDDPDLRVRCFTPESLNIEKNLEEQTFHLVGDLRSERAKWSNKSGKIVTIPDLAGSQLFISFASHGSPQLKELRRNLSLNTIILTFGNRSKRISFSLLDRHVSSDGIVFWEFIFPKNEAELFARQ